MKERVGFMELREINDMCNNLGAKILKINEYKERGLVPNSGSPYLINEPDVFFTVISVGTAQAKAPEAEKFIARKMGWTKISPSLNKGDFKTAENKYIELKNSFSNKAGCLNLRQIRLWQEVDYYLCIYIDETNISDSVVLLLTHEQMEKEVTSCGSATHGTAAANANNQNIEYSITIKVGSPMMTQWIEKYDAPADIKNQIIGG